MKYSILGFNQQEVLKCQTVVDMNGKQKEISVDVTDLLILQCVADFMNRSSICKYVVNDKVYFSIQYGLFVDDLPILNIGKQALRDRIDKLVLFDILEKEVIKNEQGSFSVFRIGKRYEQLKYNNHNGDEGEEIEGGCVSNYTPKNYINTNNKEKEDNKLSSKKKEKSCFVVPTIEEVNEYIQEKGYHFSGEDFWHFYESKGWMVGKNKMKQWKSSCALWESKCRKDEPSLFETPTTRTTSNAIEINNQIYR